MTTDTIPSFSAYLSYRLKARANRRVRVNRTTIQLALANLTRIVLHLAGFGFLTWAGFQFTMIAGTIVAGISCFVLSSLLSGGNSNAPADPMANRGR